MIRILGTLIVLVLAFLIFFVGTEIFSLQDGTIGNTVLGGVAALTLVALFKIWRN